MQAYRKMKKGENHAENNQVAFTSAFSVNMYFYSDNLLKRNKGEASASIQLRKQSKAEQMTGQSIYAGNCAAQSRGFEFCNPKRRRRILCAVF